MKKVLVLIMILAFVLASTAVRAAPGGNRGDTGTKFTGPKSQAGMDIEAPRGLMKTQGGVPPGWTKGNDKSHQGFLKDPNLEPFGFDQGKGTGWKPK